jgi:hypothetical protein
MIALPTFRGALAGFNPRSLSPALWVNDTGSDPSVWTDISGNGRNAVQATGANQPSIVTNVINGRQVRRFDGTTTRLIPPDFNLDNSTIFSVVIPNSPTPSTAGAIFAIGANTGYSRDILCFISNASFITYFNISRSDGTTFPTSSISTTNLTAQITTGKFTGTNLVTYVNNGTRNNVATTISGSTQNKPAIGVNPENGTFQYYYRGDIAELIVYPSSLSDANCLRVEKYLSNKYNIAIA